MPFKRFPLLITVVTVVTASFIAGCSGLTPNVAAKKTNPVPSVASLSPNSVVAGGAAFTLTVNGTNFLSTSAVQWNGSVRPTTFVSITQLQAQISASDVANGGTVAVTVVNPAPGGGTSTSVSFTISNPVPSITSLTPNSSLAGAAAFTLTVTGANFVPSSVVQWNAGARSTTLVSSTQLQAQINVADVAAGGTDVVTVANAAPGGGTSATSTFTVNNLVPTITSLNPNSAFAGGAAFTLTVTGTNFIPSSSVQWNGAARPTTFVSGTSLQAAITAADISAVGTAPVTVSNPPPGGGISAASTFTIKAPGPVITLLNPSSAVSGGAAFTLAVTGTGFLSSSTVQWNGSPRTTTFVSSTSLQAAITAPDIATAGTANVTVSNAAGGGGVSSASTFFVGTSGGANFAVIALNQAAQDIVYDLVNHVFYLSVTGAAATHPNTISVLDPSTATITSSQTAGSNPNVLAISDNSQFLYAGIDGANKVQRFSLPSLATDISYPLGSNSFGAFFALDLQVAPGAPHATAVTLANTGVSPAAQGGITIFDDATARATSAKGGTNLYGSLQWGSDATALFAANNETSGSDFYTLSVNSSGVTLSNDFPKSFAGSFVRIHFDSGSKLIYADEGHVVNPATGTPAGNFNTAGLMVPDSTLNTSFFISSPSAGTVTIDSFDQTHFTPITSITIPSVAAAPTRLIRWAQNGLAFITGGASGQVYLIGGNFVSPAPPLALTPPPTPTAPPTPAINAPTIASLSPSSASAGGAAFTLTVTGTNFVAASTVQWNGSPRTTTFVSATSLQAAITAADIATVGAASVTVLNPSASGGLSAPSSFFVGSTAGTSSGGASFAVTLLNQVSKELVYDPLHQEIFLSVPNVSSSGNTISVVDLATATIAGAQFAGSNPDVLAISDDGQFLYAGLDGSSSVQRFILPGLAPDISYPLGGASLGPYFALDLQVAPGTPHTTAVTLANFGVSPAAQGGIAIFDDATARATKAAGGAHLFDSLQWGSTASALFAANNESTGFDFYTLSVNSSGVTFSQDFPNAFSSFTNRIHFDAGTQLIYGDEGHVVNPASGAAAGNFNTSGRIVPDSTLNRAFFLTGIGSPTITVTSYDLTLFTKIDSLTVSGIAGNPQHLIRWGQNGLAFNTDAGQLVLLGGNFIH